MQQPFSQCAEIPLREEKNGFHLARIVRLRTARTLPTAIQQTAKAAKSGKSSDRRRRVFHGVGGRQNGFFRKLFAPALTHREQFFSVSVSYGSRGRFAE
jgi:hypothetical protein